MTTDRELLELAAKAAGVSVEWKTWVVSPKAIAGCCHRYKDKHEYWNPLTDDGDAQRLAVKLNLHVGPVPKLAGEYGYREAWDNEGRIAVSEPTKGEPYAATRRAIVRAAAEIGRMK